MTNQVRVLVTAKDEVSGPMDKLRDKFSTMKAEGAQGFFAGVGAAATVKAFSLADQAISRTVDFLGDAVQAARDEEVSIQKLNTSLAANVKGWDGNTDAIERTIKARMDLGFADDAQRDSLAKLVAATGDVDKALAVQRTAMDLARFKGIDLATATDALIKVESGQYRMLKSLGIELGENATQTEALAAVQKVAAGQAEDYMETSAGGAEELSVKLGELSEKAGGVLLPVVDDLTDGLIELVDAMDSDNPVDFAGGLLEAADALNNLNPLTWQTKAAMNGAEDALQGAGRKMGTLSREVEDTDDGLGDLEETTYDAAEAMDDLREEVEDATDAFLEAAFGAKELRLKLISAKDEMGENQTEADKLRKKIERFRDAGKDVGELEDDLRDLRGEIIDDKKEIISTTSKMEALGEVPLGSTRTQIQRLLGPLDAAGDEALALYNALNLASNVRLTSIPDGPRGRTGQHAGGVNSPYTSRLVGEHGPEVVQFGAVGGMVHASAAATGVGGTGGGGPVIVQVMLDGRQVAEAVAPGVTAWQQARF